MILSYCDIFSESAKKRIMVEAELTTEHPASSYGRAVIVLSDGGALDLVSWVAMNYRVEKATDQERAGLAKLGLIE